MEVEVSVYVCALARSPVCILGACYRYWDELTQSKKEFSETMHLLLQMATARQTQIETQSS